MVQKSDESIAGIEMAIVVFQVVVRQQHLRNMEVERSEQLPVSRHEPGLSDGGAGLEIGQLSWSFFVIQRAHAGRDRPRGHEDNFLARLALGGDLAHQLPDLSQIQLFSEVGYDAGAQFNNHSANFFQDLTAHGSQAKWKTAKVKRKN